MWDGLGVRNLVHQQQGGNAVGADLFLAVIASFNRDSSGKFLHPIRVECHLAPWAKQVAKFVNVNVPYARGVWVGLTVSKQNGAAASKLASCHDLSGPLVDAE